jgi:hypothetical protein
VADAPAFVVGVAEALSKSMGGTSGALLEIFFRALARSLREQGARVRRDGGDGDGTGGGGIGEAR